MPTTTDLLIGSYPNLEAQTLSVTASASTEPCELATNSWYLYDDFSAWDLFAGLGNAINLHSALSDVALVLGVDLRIRLVSSVSFSMVLPTDNILRNLLGFTASLSPSALTHTAANISPLLWSPGKPMTQEARVGTDGIPIADTAVGMSGPGTLVAREFNEYRRDTLSARYLLNSKVWTAAEAGGEFISFWRNVLRLRRRFKVWRNYPEDLTDHSTLQNPNDSVNPGPLPSSGAYKYTGPNEMPWGREFNYVDSLHPLTLPVVQTREYDAP
jgi:hypothetical protein